MNDSDSVLQGIAERIVGDLGREVPWHVTRYFPAYQFTAPPTPARTLERAWQIGKARGLDFVYMGNEPGHRHNNTDCPACGALLIRRLGFGVVEYRLDAGKCPQCGRFIPGVWDKR